MQISYRKLWILLAERELNKTMLQNMTGLSSASMAKLSKNENVNTATLLKICSSLKCNLGDIADATEARSWRAAVAPSLFNEAPTSPTFRRGTVFRLGELFCGPG